MSGSASANPDVAKAASNSNDRPHLDYLDGLRGLAALYIVIHHASLSFTLKGANQFQASLMAFLFYGHYAVDIFIVLSGFCLMLPVVRHEGYLRHGTLDFFKRRAHRILPPYYLALGVSMLLVRLWDSSIPFMPKDVIVHLCLLQDVFTDTCSTINGALWSIPVECRIYVLFPLLLMCWRRWGRWVTLLASLLISGVAWVALDFITFRFPALNLNIQPWGPCPHYLSLFVLGMIGAELTFSPTPLPKLLQSNRTWLALTAMMGLLVWVLNCLNYNFTWHGYDLPWQVIDLVVGVTIANFMVAISPNLTPASKTSEIPAPTLDGTARFAMLIRRDYPLRLILAWPPLVLMGTFAYSIYLIHGPLLALIHTYLIVPLQLPAFMAFVTLAVPGTTITVTFCYLFFLLGERPFLNRR